MKHAIKHTHNSKNSNQLNDILSFGINWDFKTITLFIVLLALPNLLGLLNISTPWGFQIHFFQFAVFLAALIYGPLGGLFSGAIGSTYSAVLMHNPYLIVGNALLGFFVGLFARYGLHAVFAVLLAFIIQLAWLIPSDYYWMHLPAVFITGLVITLLISNVIWAVIASYLSGPIKKAVHLK